MEFVTDIFELDYKKNFKVNLVGLKMPTAKDVYFRSKQHEIFQQYESARIFLSETETEDWNHWFHCDNEKYQGAFENIYRSQFFETALMYYNIIVDLSWTLCYVSAEYVIYQKNEGVDITGMVPIEEAYKQLRETENAVVRPNSPANPFEYLRSMCPEFSESINLIINFWNEFQNNDIRNLYNYIKHKGKPLYEEIDAFASGRVMGLIVNGQNHPTDIRDIQKKINLNDSINNLVIFDDNVLYPYIKELINLLEKAVNPSPIVF